MHTFSDLVNSGQVAGKRLLIREDLNVPLKDGWVSSDARLLAALPTIRMAQRSQGRVILCSHLGRPTEGHFEAQYSLAPVAVRLSELLGQSVRLVREWQGAFEVAPGEVVLLENVRFNCGENENDSRLAKDYAALCDVFVMDAFATAHRAQASTAGVIEFAPLACAGPLLSAELEALTQATKNPQGPVVAIVGGAKVSTKLSVLQSLSDKVDHLIVGGGIANTFIAADGYPVGKSLYEPDLISMAQQLIQQIHIPVPIDVVVGDRFDRSAKATVKPVAQVGEEDYILDVGPETALQYAELCSNAGTIIWNGPIGVFEWPQFASGTETLAHAIADSSAFSLAGGGDTLAALEQMGLTEKMSYVSTGGGAFLEFIEGKSLPAVAALQAKSQPQESVSS